MRRILYGALVLIVILLPMAGRLAFNHFDPTFFIVAGKQFVNKRYLPYPISLILRTGYDGQFYFKSAWDLSDPTEKAMRYDSPQYRKQRIFYPVVVSLVALRNINLIPFSMIFVNCLCLILLWWIFAKICVSNAIPWGYSLLPVMYSGLQMSLGRDLVEPLETLLIIVLLQFGMSNMILSCLLTTFALLTKETTLIFLLPISALTLWTTFLSRQKKHWSSYFWIILPYALFMAWHIFIERRLGFSSVDQGSSNFTFPLLGLVSGFLQFIHNVIAQNMLMYGVFSSLHYVLLAIYLISLVIFIFPLIKTAWQEKFKAHYAEIAWLAWLIFSLFFSIKIYEDDWSFGRVFSAFASISFFILFSNKKIPNKKFIALAIILFILMTVRLWLYV